MNVKEPDKNSNILFILQDMKYEQTHYYIDNIDIDFFEEENKKKARFLYYLINNYDNSEQQLISIVEMLKYLKKKELLNDLKKMTEFQNCINNCKKIIDLKMNNKCRSIILSRNLSRIREITEFKLVDFLENYNLKMKTLERNQIYVLELENNKYYVGLTSNIETRLKTHIKGRGAIFTKNNKPKRLVQTINCKDLLTILNMLNREDIPSQYDCEEIVTISMISKYGLERVEGAQYLGKKSRRTYFSKFCEFYEKTEFILKNYNL